MGDLTTSAQVIDLGRERIERRRPAAPEAAAGPLDASVEVAAHLARVHDAGHPAVSVSWLNHHSALAVVDRSPHVLQQLTYLGVDGLLLRRVLGTEVPRTSADAVIPPLLARLTAPRVAIVGGTPESLAGACRAVAALLPPGGRIVGARDGFAGVPEGRELDDWLAAVRPTVVLAGLGAPHQDAFVLEVARRMPSGLALTCGGFLDQVQQDGYYPAWAYPLKLNWLVRLAREPRRLWRRYTVEAVAALRARGRLRRHVLPVPALGRLQHLAFPAGGRHRDAVS
ncbi:WecB/TagA/CpsF family glycosyltransferase [Blastococcus sp. SYSU DS0619]